VYVNCSDLFDYACADAECIVSNDGEPGSEIISLYQMYKEDSKWGVEKWLSIKRNLQPIPGVKIRMKIHAYLLVLLLHHLLVYF
jgi:hypothetical protein